MKQEKITLSQLEGFLIQTHQYVEEQGQDPNDLFLAGQDSNGTTS